MTNSETHSMDDVNSGRPQDELLRPRSPPQPPALARV
jgi:hypothetical protein